MIKPVRLGSFVAGLLYRDASHELTNFLVWQLEVGFGRYRLAMKCAISAWYARQKIRPAGRHIKMRRPRRHG